MAAPARTIRTTRALRVFLPAQIPRTMHPAIADQRAAVMPPQYILNILLALAALLISATRIYGTMNTTLVFSTSPCRAVGYLYHSKIRQQRAFLHEMMA